MWNELGIFFGFLAFSLLVMVCIYKIASMYVHGDFVLLKSTEEPAEEEEGTNTLGYEDGLKTHDDYVHLQTDELEKMGLVGDDTKSSSSSEFTGAIPS